MAPPKTELPQNVIAMARLKVIGSHHLWRLEMRLSLIYLSPLPVIL